MSARPYLEARAVDSHLVTHVQYAPYALAGAEWDTARRRALGDLVVDQLAPHLPDLRDRLKGVHVQTPRDLEEKCGVTEGQAYHGELTLDQILFMRPVAGWSRYRTPIGGLYLCGSGTHPGGGILGGPGRLAAAEILKDD